MFRGGQEAVAGIYDADSCGAMPLPLARLRTDMASADADLPLSEALKPSFRELSPSFPEQGCEGDSNLLGVKLLYNGSTP